MAERRPLTKEEAACAAEFAAAMKRSGLNAETLGPEWGVTPGAVRHWTGELPIPLDRVARVAARLQVDPSKISVRWREHVGPYLGGSSQAARPDPGRLADLIETVEAGVAGTRLARDAKTKARLVVALYMDAKVETASRETVAALLSGILASMEHLK